MDKPWVLIVDDNPVNLTLAKGLFKPFAIHIDTAESGKAALEMIQFQRYDMVLMDYIMPSMDGIETVKRLRSIEGPYYQNLPVIALSAAEQEDLPEDLTETFVKAGMNGFIEKPLRTQKIREILKKWFPEALLPDEAAGFSEAEEDVPVLDGIDSGAGIASSGSKELFIRLLGDFYKLIDLKSEKIRRCLAAGDIRGLTVEVHGLRNTARLIGATALSDKFASLEHLGNSGDLTALERETPEVLKLYGGFKTLLEPYGRTPDIKRHVPPGEITALLDKLTEAIDRFDLDGADSALLELDGIMIPDKCAAHMERLRAYVADVAMEEAMVLAEAMKKMINGTE
ncbi:MAG: response regulator [Clostridiales bacterium]|jgi:CheY-like chemotaxis protein/HPt (histidine-containing phosphotransfer) domain-containing protein|nr:response regulator [Clostridiales bacterium]